MECLFKGFSDELIKENLLIVSVFLNNQNYRSIPDRYVLFNRSALTFLFSFRKVASLNSVNCQI